jgi:hypothetical protein
LIGDYQETIFYLGTTDRETPDRLPLIALYEFSRNENRSREIIDTIINLQISVDLGNGQWQPVTKHISAEIKKLQRIRVSLLLRSKQKISHKAQSIQFGDMPLTMNDGHNYFVAEKIIYLPN